MVISTVKYLTAVLLFYIGLSQLPCIVYEHTVPQIQIQNLYEMAYNAAIAVKNEHADVPL